MSNTGIPVFYIIVMTSLKRAKIKNQMTMTTSLWYFVYRSTTTVKTKITISIETSKQKKNLLEPRIIDFFCGWIFFPVLLLLRITCQWPSEFQMEIFCIIESRKKRWEKISQNIIIIIIIIVGFFTMCVCVCHN